MMLTGAAGENVGNWTLGFIQLSVPIAHYRGATVRDGSIKATSSNNNTLCRDAASDTSTEVWYNPLYSGWVVAGPTGTNKLAPATVLPPKGSLSVQAGLSDQPFRRWPDSLPNTVVTGQPINFLHYAVFEVLFCTMLVAQDPAGNFHMLKHFYWNVIWEQIFKRNGTSVVVDRAIRLEQNVQHVQNGNDPKFFGKEYDTTLPISNKLSKEQPKIIPALDWRYG